MDVNSFSNYINSLPENKNKGSLYVDVKKGTFKVISGRSFKRITALFSKSIKKADKTSAVQEALDKRVRTLQTEQDYEELREELLTGIAKLRTWRKGSDTPTKLEADLENERITLDLEQSAEFSPYMPKPPTRHLTNQQAYAIDRYVARNKETLLQSALAGDDYLRSSRTGLPCAIQLFLSDEDDLQVIVHLKRRDAKPDGEGQQTHTVSEGRGCQKRVRRSLLMPKEGSGWKTLATATPKPLDPNKYSRALECTAREQRLLERLRGKEGVLQIVAHSFYEIKKGENEGEPKTNIVMPMARCDLYEVITKKMIPSEDVYLDLAEELLAGLANIHEEGIVHFDIKPENILILEEGEAVISDFGLALEIDEDLQSPLRGTPGYMAPEVVQAHYFDSANKIKEADECMELIGPVSDVYSMGLTLFLMKNPVPYHMMMGFEAGDTTSIKNYLDEMQTFCDNLPRDTEENCILADMLKYNPAERISAEEALNRWSQL